MNLLGTGILKKPMLQSSMKVTSKSTANAKMTLIKHSRNHTSAGSNLRGSDAQALKLPWKSAGGMTTDDGKVIVPAQVYKSTVQKIKRPPQAPRASLIKAKPLVESAASAVLHQSLGKMTNLRSPTMSTHATKKLSEQETTATASITKNSRHVRHKSGGTISMQESISKDQVRRQP